MTPQMACACTLSLNGEERETLLEVLEEELKRTQIEEHRTDALRAKEVVHTREEVLEALLRKVRTAGPG